ncbi:MAG: hypothetical protein U0Z75_00530 [Deinococcaceae bacterium]
MHTFIRCEDGKFINLSHVAFFQAEQEYGMFRLVAYLIEPMAVKNVGDSTQRIVVKTCPDEVENRTEAQAVLSEFLKSLREGSSFDSNIQIYE